MFGVPGSRPTPPLARGCPVGSTGLCPASARVRPHGCERGGVALDLSAGRWPGVSSGFPPPSLKMPEAPHASPALSRGKAGAHGPFQRRRCGAVSFFAVVVFIASPDGVSAFQPIRSFQSISSLSSVAGVAGGFPSGSDVAVAFWCGGERAGAGGGCGFARREPAW